MHLDIQARGFALSDGMRVRVARRLRYALGAAATRLTALVVRLTDHNGPRGGRDKSCTIRAVLPRSRPVVIEQRDSDLYAAIDVAAGRAGFELSRRLARAIAGRRAVALSRTS
ncbi:MAG: HPF/RaiA family ribosome-associated protein [Burkholderiales bacterium]